MMTPQDVATWAVLLAGALTAAGYLARLLWRAVKAVERAVTDLAGAGDQRSLRQEVVDIRVQVDEVKAIAERSERELHPNGGSSMRDDVRLAVAGVEDARANVVEARADARRAAEAVMELKARGDELAAQVTAFSEEGVRGRAEIRDAQRVMREEIAQDYATNTAIALEILAENGGPDLRGKLPPPAVADHVHDVPAPQDPLTTSPPHPPEPS